MLTQNRTLRLVSQNPIVAIMRADSASMMVEAAKALVAGGVSVIEITLTTPGALDAIAQAQSEFGDEIAFGAGSVLDPESARAAILAGAQFIVTPTLKLSTIELCKRYGVAVMPGAYTPTEILTAWEAGADLVKVFPSEMLGPRFIKSVKAPMPQLKLAPVGGISTDNLRAYLDAGADAVGVGSSLINSKLLRERDFKEITRRAQVMTDIANNN